MKLCTSNILNKLSNYPQARTYWVALSGGCDSVVLLHLLAACRDKLTNKNIKALHIHHGLSKRADEWQRFCEDTCKQLNIPLKTHKVDATQQKGQSPEEAARHARYDVYARELAKGDVMLLAHHANDQAETLLLNLLRGSGSRGLSAMPECRTFADGLIVRPLLKWTREQIEHYAIEHKLSWVNDESNLDTSFDRNYLRHKVIPVIQQRWPSSIETIERSAELNAISAELNDELARLDIEHVLTDNAGIDVRQLKTLSHARIANLLRYWLVFIRQLPAPEKVHIEHIINDVVHSKYDASPCVKWSGASVRRYRYELLAELEQATNSNDAVSVLPWDLSEQLLIPDKNLTLTAEQCCGRGLNPDKTTEGVSIRFRQGGETCVMNQHHRQLKKMFQEWGVPSWQRDQIPLIYIGTELAQVVGYHVCTPFRAEEKQPGIDIIAHPYENSPK